MLLSISEPEFRDCRVLKTISRVKSLVTLYHLYFGKHETYILIMDVFHLPINLCTYFADEEKCVCSVTFYMGLSVCMSVSFPLVDTMLPWSWFLFLLLKYTREQTRHWKLFSKSDYFWEINLALSFIVWSRMFQL